MNILEERGTFWWANEPKEGEQPATPKDTTGVLRVTDKGKIFLDLDGSLLPPKKKGETIVAKGGSVNLEGKIIYGILSAKNQYVYLSDLWGGFLFRQFQVGSCLVGRNKFPPGATLPTISKIGISLDGYEDWFCLEPIALKENDDEISFTYKIPRKDVYETPNADIYITYQPNWHCGSKADVPPSVYLKYLPKTPLSLHGATQKFRLIEDLFIVLTDSEYSMKWPRLTLSDNEMEYTYYFYRNTNNAEGPGRHESPTNFVLLRSSFGEVITMWEQKYNFLGSAFYSFLGTKRGITLYIEDQFRTLVGGLEAFHRKISAPPIISDKLKKQIQRILDQMEPKDKRLANLVLKRAHITEPPLCARLYDLLKKVRPDLDKNKLRAFTDSCAKDRNDLAHFAGQRDPNDNTIFYQRLIRASNALSYLYHALILSEIGVKQEIIDAWFEKGFCSYRIKRAFVDTNLLDNSVLEPPKPNTEKE